MKLYTVIALAANVPAGSLLALTDEQIARRAHSLEPAKDKRAGGAGRSAVRATAALQFKRGEEIAVIEAPGIGKAMLAEVAPSDSPPAKKAKAETEAKRRAAAAKAKAAQREGEEEDSRRRQIKAEGRGRTAAPKRAAPTPPAGTAEREGPEHAGEGRPVERPEAGDLV